MGFKRDESSVVRPARRYTIYSVSREALEAGAWRGRAALVAVAGDVAGRAASLLLAHLLDGGRLLALCSDLLHTVLPYYKTAEVSHHSSSTLVSLKLLHSYRLSKLIQALSSGLVSHVLQLSH